jgi:hypothetical protein
VLLERRIGNGSGVQPDWRDAFGSPPTSLSAIGQGVATMSHPEATSASDGPVQIVLRFDEAPDAASTQTLAVLRQAVAQALDRKRRLGQYAVFWQDGKVVRVEARDLPALP